MGYNMALRRHRSVLIGAREAGAWRLAVQNLSQYHADLRITTQVKEPMNTAANSLKIDMDA
jgi:hypothetical protein